MCVGVPVVALQTGPFSVVQRGQWVHRGHARPALVLELQQKLRALQPPLMLCRSMGE